MRIITAQRLHNHLGSCGQVRSGRFESESFGELRVDSTLKKVIIFYFFLRILFYCIVDMLKKYKTMQYLLMELEF